MAPCHEHEEEVKPVTEETWAWPDAQSLGHSPDMQEAPCGRPAKPLTPDAAIPLQSWQQGGRGAQGPDGHQPHPLPHALLTAGDKRILRSFSGAGHSAGEGRGQVVPLWVGPWKVARGPQPRVRPSLTVGGSPLLWSPCLSLYSSYH